MNDAIVARREIAEAIFDRSVDFKRNPDCRLFYATTGDWTGDKHVVARTNAELAALRSLNLFSAVDFIPLDAAALKIAYKNLKRHIVQDVEFERHAILPRIERVAVAYIGILPIREYLKLIVTPDGRLNKSVFYENIRDFQGDTPVNTEISETLRSPDQVLLPILNNGITVVAREVAPTGTRFRLTDFQVVNGCQTSHALFYCRGRMDLSVCIPVKLIGTSDPEIASRIIRATNRQTEIKPEAFIALSPFHKELEAYYDSLAKDGVHPLYYERRSRQYDGSSVRPYQIVTVAAQVANFVAVFLEEPHSCHRYYGEIIMAYRDRLFAEDHRVAPYYLSSLIMYRLDGLFRNDTLAPYLRHYRYHVAFVACRHAGGPPPPLNSKKMDDYCERVLQQFRDSRTAMRLFDGAAEVVKRSLVDQSADRTAARTRAFTQLLAKE